MIQKKGSPVVLAILDGWGIGDRYPGNAIDIAQTPNFDRFCEGFPYCKLQASGEAVGLPPNEDGNTETGHLNLGAGYVVYQDLQRINVSIQNESFFSNTVLLRSIAHAKENKSSIHLMGLVGQGGVHSNLQHLLALLTLFQKNSFYDVYIHLFTDGRDSPQTSAPESIRLIDAKMKETGVGKFASIMGRYWAMDRDNRWDRTIRAYTTLTENTGKQAQSVYEVLEASYAQGITDEFIEPTVILDENKNPIKRIGDNDAVIFFNFRIDRPRQLSKLFLMRSLSPDDLGYGIATFGFHASSTLTEEDLGLSKRKIVQNLYFVTMTQYSRQIVEAGAYPAFPPEVVAYPLSRVISESGHHQLKITESEKERFVTYYFNGLRENAFPAEDRVIIPSPKVATYDMAPEMSAQDITDVVVHRIMTDEYSFIAINYPNADMVGHTGNIGAAVVGIEKVDSCLGILATAVLAKGGTLIITGDHGNAEEMINEKTGAIDTEHSQYPVPFIAISQELSGKKINVQGGKLADIATTILELLEIEKPKSMTGGNLLSEL